MKKSTTTNRKPTTRKAKSSRELDAIIVKGAKEHNLKDIHISLPKKKMIVFTGVSGSGKSSLALDTIFAEGQRRYVESLSAYARQFIGQMEKPKYDTIRGLSPTIAIEQYTIIYAYYLRGLGISIAISAAGGLEREMPIAWFPRS